MVAKSQVDEKRASCPKESTVGKKVTASSRSAKAATKKVIKKAPSKIKQVATMMADTAADLTQKAAPVYGRPSPQSSAVPPARWRETVGRRDAPGSRAGTGDRQAGGMRTSEIRMVKFEASNQ